MQYECKHCGKSFYGRGDAKYCGNTCRQRAHRRKQQMKREADRAISSIRFIQQYQKQYPELSITGGLELDRIQSALSVTAASVTGASRHPL